MGDMEMPEPGNIDRTSSRVPNIKLGAVAPQIAAPTPNRPGVFTRSADNYRSGSYDKETILTPAAVAQKGMRKLFSVRITGDDTRGTEAQPLVYPNVTISDGTAHDLLIAATMANTISAFDANDGTLLWTQRFGNPIVNSRTIDGWMINDHWGILSTPVADPETNTLYFVTWSSPDGTPGKAVHTFHSIDLSSGRDVASPINLDQVSYDPGNGLPVQYFKNSQRKQRASLTLATISGRKTIIIPFGTISETSATARGWVVAIDAVSNRVGAAWTATSRYSGAGIWMAGQGMAVDPDGYIYGLTGNGSFDAKTEFAESFIKLKYTPPAGTQVGTISIADWWTPWTDSGRAGGPANGDRITKNIGGGWDDADLGSGGIALVPDYKLLFGGGKDGILYILHMNNLGKTQLADFLNPAANYAKLASPAQWFTYAAFKHNAQGQVIGYEDTMPADPMKLNFLYDNKTHHEHSTPVVLKQANSYYLYCMGENGNLRAWSLDKTGTLTYLANGAESASSQVGTGMPGGMMAVSSNGIADGIVWVTVPYRDANKEVTQGVVIAYDATNFGTYGDGAKSIKTLWTSPAYTYNKFCVPIVSGGKVYVPTYNGYIDVYSLN
jgi:hypothetical protein